MKEFGINAIARSHPFRRVLRMEKKKRKNKKGRQQPRIEKFKLKSIDFKTFKQVNSTEKAHNKNCEWEAKFSAHSSSWRSGTQL